MELLNIILDPFEVLRSTYFPCESVDAYCESKEMHDVIGSFETILFSGTAIYLSVNITIAYLVLPMALMFVV